MIAATPPPLRYAAGADIAAFHRVDAPYVRVECWSLANDANHPLRDSRAKNVSSPAPERGSHIDWQTRFAAGKGRIAAGSVATMQ